jgi:ankyrin repeat protein
MSVSVLIVFLSYCSPVAETRQAPAKQTGQTPAAEKQEAVGQKDEITALIDKLRTVADGDVGYIPTQSGGGFLPLGVSERGALLLGQKGPTTSGTMLELVKRGAAAVPQLIAHLEDKRVTKIAIKHEGGFGGIFFNDEYDYNSRTNKQPPQGVNRDEHNVDKHPNNHTVTVGDLCFVALGQIVNRHFNAVRYQPTACIMINSPTYSEALRKAVKQEWSDLTPQKHKESLIQDFSDPDYEARRTGACLRLGYYYPDALELLVLKQLVAPIYNKGEVGTLIRDKLYRSKDVKERKTLFDDFIAKHGDVARQGVLVYLFGDLDTQEADERGSLSPPLKDKYAACVCLIEFYGYPKDVKSTQRPHLLPTSESMQARFIDAVAFFPTTKIDKAVRAVLRSTDDDYLSRSCARYLVGRGADADIQHYVQQRLKKANKERQRQLQRLLDQLGWTQLHVAAEHGEPSIVENAIAKGADINAQAANGQTALHVAADHGMFGAIDILIKRKADLNIKDKQGRTPVQLAIAYDAAAEMLLAAGAEPSDILVAAFAGRADLVEGFLKKDKSLVKATIRGETPLHFAARLGHIKVVKVLLSSGAPVNASDGSQLTPLHRAASYGQHQVVKLLLASKADRSAKSWDGKTALDFAKESGDAKTIKLLSTK